MSSKRSSKHKISKAEGRPNVVDIVSTKELMTTINNIEAIGMFESHLISHPEAAKTGLHNGYHVVFTQPIKPGVVAISMSDDGKKSLPFIFYIDYALVSDEDFREYFVDLLKSNVLRNKGGNAILKRGLNMTPAILYAIATYLGISGDDRSKIDILEDEFDSKIRNAYDTLSPDSFSKVGDKSIVSLLKQKERFEKYKGKLVKIREEKNHDRDIPLTDVKGSDGGYIQELLPASFYKSRLDKLGLGASSAAVDLVTKHVNQMGLVIINALTNIAQGYEVAEIYDNGVPGVSLSQLFGGRVPPRRIKSKSVVFTKRLDPPSTAGVVQQVRLPEKAFEGGPTFSKKDKAKWGEEDILGEAPKPKPVNPDEHGEELGEKLD